VVTLEEREVDADERARGAGELKKRAYPPRVTRATEEAMAVGQNSEASGGNILCYHA
jgi:hypothetical protein